MQTASWYGFIINPCVEIRWPQQIQILHGHPIRVYPMHKVPISIRIRASLSHMLIPELVLEGRTLLIVLALGDNSILNWVIGSIKPHGWRVGKN